MTSEIEVSWPPLGAVAFLWGRLGKETDAMLVLVIFWPHGIIRNTCAESCFESGQMGERKALEHIAKIIENNDSTIYGDSLNGPFVPGR